LNQVRSDPALRELPTIVCSGDLEALKGVTDALAGMRRVSTIRKPFAVDEMLKTLQRVVERESA